MKTTQKVKGLMTLQDMSPKEIIELVNNAIFYKKNHAKFLDVLKGKRAYLLFEKTSTRTRTSLESGFALMGGFPLYVDGRTTNFSLSELKDEVRYICRNVDLIAARMLKNSDMAVLMEYSDVPVINTCCNVFHPCQALADIMTIFEKFGKDYVGKTVAFTGKLNNVSRELINALPKLGIKLYFVSPDIDSVAGDPNIDPECKASANLFLTKDFEEAVKKSDVVYTDTWIDMEFFNDPKLADKKEQTMKLMMPYQLNSKVFDWNKNIFVMHDMPMHIGYEITREVVEHKNTWIFDQAENRMWAQNALILSLLGYKKNKDTFVKI